MKDYYSLLGIEPGATKAEIKINYRQLATKFHPDKNSDPDAASKFIIITEAYDILSNRKSKTQYDLMRWEMLKRTKESKDSDSIVLYPRESARTRRNKAQQKRSEKFHQAKTQTKRIWCLILESLQVIARYIPHLIGIILMVVIINSAVSQLSDIFDSGIGRGIGISIFIVALAYGIFRLVQLIYEEFRKDIEAFSIFYKIPQRTAAFQTFTIVVGILLVLAIVWKVN